MARLLESDDYDDSAATALVNAIFAGYPVANVRVLLSSENPRAVEAGAWVASELGSTARDLLPDATRLLSHDLMKARFFALDVVVVCADERDGEVVARAIELVNDPHDAVQWKSLSFLAAVPSEVLRAAPASLAPDFHELVDWLVQASADEQFAGQLEPLVRDADQTRRRFAVAAVARSANAVRLLDSAVSSPDPIVRDFASMRIDLARFDRRLP